MNRRAFLKQTSSVLALPAFGRAPAFVQSLGDARAPLMPGGVQVGDVTGSRAMIWSATDRPSRMMIELARDERFTASRVVEGPVALDRVCTGYGRLRSWYFQKSPRSSSSLVCAIAEVAIPARTDRAISEDMIFFMISSHFLLFVGRTFAHFLLFVGRTFARSA